MVGTYPVWCSEHPRPQSLRGCDGVRSASKARPLHSSGLLLWVQGPAPCPQEILDLAEGQGGGHTHRHTYRGSIFSAGMLFIMLLWTTWNYRTDSGPQGVHVCKKKAAVPPTPCTPCCGNLSVEWTCPLFSWLVDQIPVAGEWWVCRDGRGHNTSPL